LDLDIFYRKEYPPDISFTSVPLSKKEEMELPKFMLGDNTDCPDDIFVIHTEFPRFVINLVNDEVEWFDDLEGDETELANEVSELIEMAGNFYDREMERYAE
jgi:hypothetical protein